MAEIPISISSLNDFIFCPVSIYFHGLDQDTDVLTYQTVDQINGTAAHHTVDSGTYSENRDILQSFAVYSEQYNLYGKIDIYDRKNHVLTERKKKVTRIYEGYIFQVYAQYFGLKEAGYVVDAIFIYSMDDHKKYRISLPSEDAEMLYRFENLIQTMDQFQLASFRQSNRKKCEKCIYEPLCSFSVL